MPANRVDGIFSPSGRRILNCFTGSQKKSLNLKHIGEVFVTAKRQGEKIGWTAGWIGGFIWVAILSIVFIYQKKIGQGLFGLFITVTAIATIFSFAPWRYPSTPYWKLMLAPYGMLFIAIAWVIWSYGSIESLGLNWWNLLWLIPALSPFGFLSNRKWVESDAQHVTSADEKKSRL